jgi:hypothetical protein
LAELVKTTHIPNYIVASSPQGLRRLMLKNNIRLGGFVSYYQITFAEGKWFAWFLEDVQDAVSKPEVKEGEK